MVDSLSRTRLSRELKRELDAWHPFSPSQASLRDEYLEFLRGRGVTALQRDGYRSHLTASCFVFSADLHNLVLCLHKKGRFWVQMGGHIEPADRSVSAAAFREAVEEAGLAITPVTEHPLDLDRHELGSGFSSCDVHWDIGFAAIAANDALPVVSSESDDVRWWPVTALPSGVPGGFADRVDRIRNAIAKRS